MSPRSSARLPTVVRRLAVGVATGLCVLAFPFALVGYNLRGVALDERFYLAEFARYGIAAHTGFSTDELRLIANAFIDYFRAPPGRMNVQLARGGTVQVIFNERELAHMEDVQLLIQGLFRLQELAVGYIAAYVVVGTLLERRAFLPRLARMLLLSGALTVALFVALGGLALVDFSELFLRFHLVSFANDLWLLDPRTDNLIRLFPQGFFQDAALRIAVATLLQAFALAAGGALGLWLAHRRAGRQRA